MPKTRQLNVSVSKQAYELFKLIASQFDTQRLAMEILLLIASKYWHLGAFRHDRGYQYPEGEKGEN